MENNQNIDMYNSVISNTNNQSDVVLCRRQEQIKIDILEDNQQ
jgi:hypothetical protein